MKGPLTSSLKNKAPCNEGPESKNNSALEKRLFGDFEVVAKNANAQGAQHSIKGGVIEEKCGGRRQKNWKRLARKQMNTDDGEDSLNVQVGAKRGQELDDRTNK